MVHADTILEAFVVACRQSDFLPNGVTYSSIELDGQGDHSNIDLPIIEFTIDDIERNQSRNTERVGVLRDEDGNESGFIYELWLDMLVDVEILTASSTSYNHRELEQQFQKTMYAYDSHGLDQQLPDPNDPTTELGDVSWIVYDSTNPENDFDFNPSVRTRQPQLSVGFTHEFLSTEFTEHEMLESVDVETVI